LRAAAEVGVPLTTDVVITNSWSLLERPQMHAHHVPAFLLEDLC